MCWFERKKRLAEKDRSLGAQRVSKSLETVEEEEFLLLDYTVSEIADDDSGIFFQ